MSGGWGMGVGGWRASEVRCPTCRAVQEWSDTCRRCKSDLRLLRDCAEARGRARREALRSLRDGRPLEALDAARRCHRLGPDADSARLLAACALLAGDWATALRADAEIR